MELDEFIKQSDPSLVELCSCTQRKVQTIGSNAWVSLAYKDWRPVDIELEKKPLVICIHGLTRNSNDFDYVAAQLSGQEKFRVLSLDVPGRGKSSKLATDSEYSYPTYIRIVKEWLAIIVSEIFGNSIPIIYWVGTSMGGLIAMMLSASVEFPIIQKLVLNDIGAFISAQSLERLKEYCGSHPTFSDFESAKKYIRSIYSPFEPLSDNQWDFIVRNSIKQIDNSSEWCMNYDPKITYQLMEVECKDMDIFDSIWNKIHKDTRVLLIRGETSDILVPETVEKMRNSGPGIEKLVTIPKVGHAPMLMSSDQTIPIRDFFVS